MGMQQQNVNYEGQSDSEDAVWRYNHMKYKDLLELVDNDSEDNLDDWQRYHEKHIKIFR